MALYVPHGFSPDPKCIVLGACQCGQQCLACGWSKCICSAKWSRDSWPHSKDYDDAHLELAKRLRHSDRIVDKCVFELTLSQFRSVKQLREWVWYVMDFRRKAELAWAQRTMHRGPAVRWMGLQGVNLGIAVLGKNVSWYDLRVRKWPCNTKIPWERDIDPKAWTYYAFGLKSFRF